MIDTSLANHRANPCPATPMLSVDDLVKHFRIRGRLGRQDLVRSVDGVSLDVMPGEVFGIVGESGCGKSTLARAILKLTPVDDGRVLFEGTDLATLSGARLKSFRRNVQIVFQDPYAALDPRMTIEQSLMAPLSQHRIGTPAERNAAIVAMLHEVGLDETFLPRKPSECSGGQLQRVVIARALLLKPRLLICDEPTSALDASIRAQILNLLMDLKSRFGLTMIMISHDLRVVRYICDRVAVMYLGKVVELASRDVVFSNPAHPYTKALIAASMLDSEEVGGLPEVPEGETPSPIRPPSGCRFHPRCSRREALCGQLPPRLDTVGGAHWAACHFPQSGRKPEV
ncbi:ABC transporter ATP-binding protein [Microvirga alba]|uniref:ABC transporter ATP-binding protein n=1 Tax=Microvirga alba TaxID=2791025 RepID=A0A931BUE6_9HYPH|nr:ABC transporter ATP-binding protein [Microvirga alba]